MGLAALLFALASRPRARPLSRPPRPCDGVSPMTALPLARSVPLARRQLLARRGRTIAGVVGIAVALLLVLALKAIFAGMEERLTAFIDGSGADVIVAQEGVTTMHMTQSALPRSWSRQSPACAASPPWRAIVYKGAFVETGRTARSGTDRPRRRRAGAEPRRGTPASVQGRSCSTGRWPTGSASRRRRRACARQRCRVSGEVNGTRVDHRLVRLRHAARLERVLGAPTVVSYLLVYAAAGRRWRRAGDADQRSGLRS